MSSIVAVNTHELVVRSTVPTKAVYSDYRQELRADFFHTCAYCTMSEAEAQAIRFTIDHYEPRASRPDLMHNYSNLMYVCEECNTRKGDRCPPPAARAQGYRFFRPDEDYRSSHFAMSGQRLEKLSNTGDFTIEALDLNRLALRKLRDIRKRLFECDKAIANGIMALRATPLDSLPKHVRPAAQRAISNTEAITTSIGNSIDELLREAARSVLIDPDHEPDAATRQSQRAARLKSMEVLAEGSWRAPRKSRQKRSR